MESDLQETDRRNIDIRIGMDDLI